MALELENCFWPFSFEGLPTVLYLVVRSAVFQMRGLGIALRLVFTYTYGLKDPRDIVQRMSNKAKRRYFENTMVASGASPGTGEDMDIT